MVQFGARPSCGGQHSQSGCVIASQNNMNNFAGLKIYSMYNAFHFRSAYLLVVIVACIAVVFPSSGFAFEPIHNVFGRLEYATLEGNPDPVKVKMDTGAKTSSLSAVNLREFERNGKDWIAFDVIVPKHKIDLHFEKPISRWVKIKKRSEEFSDEEIKLAPFSRRPVVKMQVCMRNQLRAVEVNLVDRSHFLYPMLLGRSAIIEFQAVVNPAIKFTEMPACQVMPQFPKEKRK